MTKHAITRGLRATVLVFTLIHAPWTAAQPFVPGRPPPPLCPYPGQAPGCLLAAPVAPLLPATQPKFVNELPQPIFYEPDRSDGTFDYYEIFSGVATLGLAAPSVNPATGLPVPFGAGSLSPAATGIRDTWDPTGTLVPGGTTRVWLGLVNPLVPTQKLFTEVWGYGQQGTASVAPILGGAATYPAMSFRATKGKPVKVMWVNNLPDQHMFCKRPLDSSYPCGIDRTLMGALGVPFTDPATGVVHNYSVGQFGSTQSPDNAMVVHLHGGEIPPDSDGFAELWFGNANTARAPEYASTAAVGQTQNVDPAFLLPPNEAILRATAAPPTGATWNGNSTRTGDPASSVLGSLIRPTGNAMIYNYPMVQEAATIWYHDHALGKTRVNVAAGPAGYFYVQDPVVDGQLWNATSDAAGYFFGDCTNGGILAGNCRDVPVVLQDRAFNADGSVSFPNGLGQFTKNKFNPLTPGPNPAVHPQWVPEYFGDHAVVNGVTWPRLTVTPAAYRIRFLDGSNARCYTLSLATAAGLPGPSFTLIAGDQGYLPAPVATPVFSICPGERYEAVIDFSALAPGTVVNLVNTAGAPFPNGITPQAVKSPDVFLANMMQFVVKAGPTVPWTAAPAATPATWTAAVKAPVVDRLLAQLNVTTPPAAVWTPPAGAVQRRFVLNEVLDPLTRAPLRVQIDGKTFEDLVTETPKRRSVEFWDLVNTTVDAHPMHLHLVQLKVIGRWTIDVARYSKAAITALPNGGISVNKAIDPLRFAIGPMLVPEPGEQGYKDTAKAYPGQMLRIAAYWDGAWADEDPVNPALTAGLVAPACEAPLATDVAVAPGPTAAGCRCAQVVTTVPVLDANGNPVLDPVTGLPQTTTVTSCGATIYEPYYQAVTSGPYVWHCHIVDHEDNEMMRPTLVIP